MWGEKTVCAAFLAGILLVLGLAFAQRTLPNEAGVVGPFQFPPCGFRLTTGLPCPTCYMTRSFTLMAHGRIARAFMLQPFGALLFLLLLGAVPLLVAALFSRQPLAPRLAPLPWRTLVLALGALALLSWAYTCFREVAP